MKAFFLSITFLSGDLPIQTDLFFITEQDCNTTRGFIIEAMPNVEKIGKCLPLHEPLQEK